MGSLEFSSAPGCLGSESGIIHNLPTTCFRSRTRNYLLETCYQVGLYDADSTNVKQIRGHQLMKVYSVK